MECAICYDTIGDTNKCVTPCGHNFCFNCIMKSTQYNSRCPYCRNELTEGTSYAVSEVDENEDEDEDEDEDADEDEERYEYADDDGDVVNTGTYDDNGFYKYPIVIETPYQLQSTLYKCVPDGYTKQYKETYERHEEENDIGDKYSLFIEIKKKIPSFNYSDMSSNPINMSYIEYSQKKEKSNIKCYEIFKRTRLIMKVIDDKKRDIYNAIRNDMSTSRNNHREEFHVIRAENNSPVIWNIILNDVA